MIKIFKNELDSEVVKKVEKIEDNCWINLVHPTTDEIKYVVDTLGIDEDLITKVLDEEELPRIEKTDNATLVVVDGPFMEDTHIKNKYTTYPLGIIICNDLHVITVSLKEFSILKDFECGKVKTFYTYKKSRFLIQLLLRTASSYLKVLNLVNADIHKKEKVLYHSTSNKQLVELLDIEKTLVYFITSLKANDVVLDKLSKGSTITLYEEDIELLEDTIVENKQGIEMCTIYKEILSSITDTYATIVSNNLNVVMKFLAGITIVLSIPTMISSFLGMNVSLGGFANQDYAFVMICFFSFLLALFVAWLLKKKDML
ncbi:MAG: magnesium transporter CorA family protein [Erysipelotrichaceae bacterium]|nr:magnesium transporter CorA family protein [Erysipelotrichaceae bacterium]